MLVEAFLITRPSVDFLTFLGLTHKALGYSVAANCDASRRQLSDTERLLSCLEALRDPKAAPTLKPNLLNHAMFGVLVFVDQRDTLEVLECASGMSFVTTETLARGVDLIYLTGTLNQWRDAVVSGTRDQDGAAQACYCKIMSLFEAEGLNVWPDFVKRHTADPRIFLLEDKRR